MQLLHTTTPSGSLLQLPATNFNVARQVDDETDDALQVDDDETDDARQVDDETDDARQVDDETDDVLVMARVYANLSACSIHD